MALKIMPHGRLQEWVAQEKGYGAGRDGADVSCACHWATAAAASERAGQLVTAAYSVAPCAIVVPPDSPGRPTSVWTPC